MVLGAEMGGHESGHLMAFFTSPLLGTMLELADMGVFMAVGTVLERDVGDCAPIRVTGPANYVAMFAKEGVSRLVVIKCRGSMPT